MLKHMKYLGFIAVMSVLYSSAVYCDTFWQPFRYNEDFSEGELNAWASYPPNQDNAYDPYTYPGNIIPGDSNTCLVTYCDPPWNEAQRLGAVKRLNCFLDPTSEISFRYYIKSVSASPELSVHVPLETGERIIFRLPKVSANAWQTATIGWNDLTEVYPQLNTRHRAGMTALVVQLKIPDGDTDMPIYFGLDDITVNAFKQPSFQFKVPDMAQLPEFIEHVALKHYKPGDTLTVEGGFESEPLDAGLRITPFVDRDSLLVTAELKKTRDFRKTDVELTAASFPAGLYRGVIAADYGKSGICETSFAFIVERNQKTKNHTGLIYDDRNIATVKKRLQSSRFESVRRTFEKEALRLRNELDPGTLVFDTDQFPEKDWLATLRAWSGSRIRISREALFFNALAFSLLDDSEAGEYCRKTLLRLSSWPQWNHPWMEKRGQHTYYPLGEFALNYSIAYDLCYDILDENEREKIRNALYDNFIEPAYRTYVVDDQVTTNSSNWISHIIGGALFAMAAIDDDLTAERPVEPLLTGSLLKMHRYITTAFGRDGSYGEGFRYFNFAMQSFAWTIPVIDRTYGIDFSGPLHTAHLETLWASNLAQNYAFTFGDSEPFLKREATATWIAAQNGPMNSWTWLIKRSEDPILAWLYHELKEYDTIHEVLYDVDGIQAGKPDTLGTVKFFRDVGTAVFKSGWGADDFTFVFRCGPFYNHQHLDQGTFFLADHGKIFIEERHDGEHHYYDDPVYRSHAIQPIAHNTIIIDDNPQSQKTGDPKDFAAGMNDHARFVQWLDSKHFAFVSGDLAGVYPDGPETLRRSVLYIKPRTILMIDEAESDTDHEVGLGLLFHTRWKKDISLDSDMVRFHKDGAVMNLYPLTPTDTHRSVLREPHFVAQINKRPLVERGYLKLSANIGVNKKLVMANLMTAKADASKHDITIDNQHGSIRVDCSTGKGGVTVSLCSDNGFSALDTWRSDGLLLAAYEGDNGIFAVNATELKHNGDVVFQAEKPVTVSLEISRKSSAITCFSENKTTLKIAVDKKPESVQGNGRPLDKISYHSGSGFIELTVDEGESEILIVH